nr:hypothetical protein B0A51_17547 [Rachicladosporium sp. CCFEE 5018]OQO28904.1 hypothetical protein B0A51_03924 [Rachicladosporium sp. CCFEE 5018]
MNTKASVAYGWGILVLAGGGAYFFAKRSINADRDERAALNEERRIASQANRRRYQDSAPSKPAQASSGILEKAADGINAAATPNIKPSVVADPAPVSQSQAEMSAKSQYEAAAPYRSRKGDRFS